MKSITKFVLVSSLFLNVALVANLLVFYNREKVIHPPIIKEVKVPTELSDWDMFTMALMRVESNYDSTAVSSVGAQGYFQITPIYIKEVNRHHNTNFTMDDTFVFESSYEIFDRMQQIHNPSYDMDTALVLHNGDHKWYRKRVMDALEDIKKYEDIRTKLITTYDKPKDYCMPER